MKAIVRISPHPIDTPERAAAEKLPMMAIKMLAEAYSANRAEDAALILDTGKDGLPVYMIVGSNPPELAIGGRQVYAVFDPPDSQEPVATFFEEAAALAWQKEYAVEGKVGKIDATDKPTVRVAVALLIVKDGRVLMGKLKQSGLWSLPEGALQVGETIESAVQRTAKVAAGLDVGAISVSRSAPYVNVFIEKAGQHFLTLVMVAEYVGGKPRIVDPAWKSWAWCDGDNPPEPRLITVQQIFDLAARNTAPPLPKNPPKLAAQAAKGRRLAVPVKKATRR